MISDASVIVTANPTAKAQFHEAIAFAVTDVFVYEIWPAAVKDSPVAAGKTRGGSYAGGGTNRRSVTVEVYVEGVKNVVGATGQDKKGQPFDRTGGVAYQSGISAAVFTQSGYGGYLEVGTRFMGARPYIFPNVERAVPLIAERAKQFIERQG